MDFETYRAKLWDYNKAFMLLSFLPTFKKQVHPEMLREFQENFIAAARAFIAETPHSVTPKMIKVPVPTEQLSMLREVNLAADHETLEQQAEAVKKQIINLGKLFSLFPHMEMEKHPLSVKDFIRNPNNNKVIYPFDYWHDCVEVYLQKEMLEKSNGQIVQSKSFQECKSTGGDEKRANLRMVAKMLSETKHLIDSVKQKQFPPRTMTGTKQPTMTN